MRAALAVARRAETELAQAQREAAARRDQLADDLARCDAARDLAERDLETGAARLAELRASASGFEAVMAERRAAAGEADQLHAAARVPPARQLAEQAAASGGSAGRNHRAGRALPRRRRAFARRRRAFAGAAAAAEQSAAEAEAIGAGRPAGDRGVAGRGRAGAGAGRAGQGRRGVDRAAGAERCGRAAGLRELEAAEQVERARARDRCGHRDRGRTGPIGERVSELGRRRAEIAAAHELEVAEPERPMQPDEAAALAARLERLERRRESLGAVNPLAAEEYEAEKVRVDELSTQCDDLDRSLRSCAAWCGI